MEMILRRGTSMRELERDVRVKDSKQNEKSRSMMRFAQACCVASPSELKSIERDRRFTKESRYSDVDARIVDFMRMFLFSTKLVCIYAHIFWQLT
jgi:hypothetical protein